jgi:hypothetical protein
LLPFCCKAQQDNAGIEQTVGGLLQGAQLLQADDAGGSAGACRHACLHPDWYRVGDMGDDGCGEMTIVLQNLADWTKYSLLGDEFGV